MYSHASKNHAAEVDQADVHNVCIKTENDNSVISTTACNKPGQGGCSETLPPFRTLFPPGSFDTGTLQNTDNHSFPPLGPNMGSIISYPPLNTWRGNTSAFDANPPYPVDEVIFSRQSGLDKPEATKNVNRRVNRNNDETSPPAHRSELANVGTPGCDYEHQVVAGQTVSPGEHESSNDKKAKLAAGRRMHATRGKERRNQHNIQTRQSERILMKLYGWTSKYKQTTKNGQKSGLIHPTYNIERAHNRETLFNYRHLIRPLLNLGNPDKVPQLQELWRQWSDDKHCRANLRRQGHIKAEFLPVFEWAWAMDDPEAPFKEGFEEFEGMM